MFQSHLNLFVLFQLLVIKLDNYVLSIPTAKITKGGEGSGNHPFVGTFVFPHGGVIVDAHKRNFTLEPGSKPESKAEAIRLHNSMKSAAKALIDTQPDLIILSTPHGFYLEESYVIISGPSMSGNAGWSWSSYSAEFTIAAQESAQIYLYLKSNQNPVEYLSLGIGQTPMPLYWGEVIPFWFIQEAAKKENFQLPHVIYIGQPPKINIAESIKLGEDIATFAKSSLSSRRISVVISGDLSHYHSSSPNAPYPYNKAAPIFDNFIKEWGQLNRSIDDANEEISKALIVEKAYSLSSSAGSCGYPGIIMLQGLLTRIVKNGGKMKCKFYDYAAPTYFGMIVTSWTI